ncbi:response regulator transcription factor [Actinocrispum sp. NPDC049592]|uniref:response regulator transcription factor n=1 Tax=Actinocrispum sp. NPDC049592 TaxID=3154835 RepID=UPI0034413EAF
MTCSVLLADDHPVARGGLKVVLGGTGIEVVAEASTRSAVTREVALHRPDVLVIDVTMSDGMAIIREVQRDTTVLVFASSTEDSLVLAAVQAGAKGYIYKSAEPADIVRAILAVAAGEAIFSPVVAQALVPRIGMPQVEPFPGLTAREREVLSLVADGLSNARIAHRLGRSPKTISNHISAIFAKLHVASRGEAVRRARAAGLA